MYYFVLKKYGLKHIRRIKSEITINGGSKLIIFYLNSLL
jgi:hypothetical protein